MEQITLSKSQLIRSRVKGVVGGSIGNLVEWYGLVCLFGICVVISVGLFSLSIAKQLNCLTPAGIFAIGFLMRPIGGWIMGTYADRKGRKAALTLSVLLMSAGSLMIMLVPGYKYIGIAAPIIWFARMLQGLSIGGEYGTAATYLSEIAPKKHRGFYSSFQYVTSCMGQTDCAHYITGAATFFVDQRTAGRLGLADSIRTWRVLSVSAIYLRRKFNRNRLIQE